MKNPFDPTFGEVPQIYLNHKNFDTAKTILHKIKSTNHGNAIFITGLRGSGKSVLLQKIEEYAKQDPNCIQLDIFNDNKNSTTSLIQALKQTTKNKILRPINEIKSISISKIGSIDLDNPTQNGLDQQAAEALKLSRKLNPKKYILIGTDDITNSKNILDFAQVFNYLKRFKVRINWIATGLPNMVQKVTNTNGLTFLARGTQIQTQALFTKPIAKKYQEILQINNYLSNYLANLTKGYQFAFQALGYVVWENIIEENLTPTLKRIQKLCIPEYQKFLYNNSYKRIVDELPKNIQLYLIAINHHQPFTKICKQLHWSKGKTSVYRSRTRKRQLIKPDGYGTMTYTLPEFSKFIDEATNFDSKYCDENLAYNWYETNNKQ